jgi:hypothetical protein
MEMCITLSDKLRQLWQTLPLFLQTTLNGLFLCHALFRGIPTDILGNLHGFGFSEVRVIRLDRMFNA